MTSVPFDPDIDLEMPNWGFAIVAKDVNGETSIPRNRGRTRKGSAIHPHRTLN